MSIYDIILSHSGTYHIRTENSCMWQPLKECIFKLNMWICTQSELNVSVSLFGFVTLYLTLSLFSHFHFQTVIESVLLLFTYTSGIILYLKWENFNRNENDGQSYILSLTLYSTHSNTLFLSISRSLSLSVCLIGFRSVSFCSTNRHTMAHRTARKYDTLMGIYCNIYTDRESHREVVVSMSQSRLHSGNEQVINKDTQWNDMYLSE